MVNEARVLLLGGILVLAAAPMARGWEQGDEESCPATESYINSMFGFSVVIPHGLHGCALGPADFTDHGLLIPLDPGGTRTIMCYAAANAELFPSIDAAIDSQLQFQQFPAYRQTSRVLLQGHTRLGGHEAGRLAVRFKRDSPASSIVSDATTVLLGESSSSSVPEWFYKVTLTTTEAMYKYDRQVLDAVLSSWRFTGVQTSGKRPNNGVHPTACAVAAQPTATGVFGARRG